MREREIEKKYRKRIEGQGGLCLKFVSPGYSGVPDRVVLMKDGRIWFVEFKSKGQKPTPRQQRVHDLIRSFGFNVLVIDEVE